MKLGTGAAFRWLLLAELTEPVGPTMVLDMKESVKEAKTRRQLTRRTQATI